MTYKRIPPDSVSPQIQNLFELYEQYLGYKTSGFFVEIGAFDGYSWSNTLTLVDAGWRGVMVEPDPDNFRKLMERHGGKRMQLIGCAIGAQAGKARLYRGGSTSTIVPETIEMYHNFPPLASTGLDKNNWMEVSVLTMDMLMEACVVPELYDVLVIDVEGGELGVLAGYDIERWRPMMAIVETHEKLDNPALSAKAIPIGEFFAEHNYVKVQADTINTVYVDRVCWEERK